MGGPQGEQDNLMDENAFRQGDVKNEIDDIPIPVSKPKTFDELLEEEMAKGNAGGIKAAPSQAPKEKPAK